MTGIHRLKVSSLVTNSLVTAWLSSVLSTSLALYIYVTSTLKFLKNYHLEVAHPVSSHNTVHPRCIHRVPASRCPQCKPFPLDSLVVLDLASFHDLYTRVPASHCPQCKPFPLDSPWVILDLKPEPQLPVVLNVSLSPWTLPWAEADVNKPCPHVTPTPSTQDLYTGLRESGPKVTSTMVQSRLSPTVTRSLPAI